MIIGAPKMGVTAFRGIIKLPPGMVVSKLHNKAIALPDKIVIGTSCL